MDLHFYIVMLQLILKKLIFVFEFCKTKGIYMGGEVIFLSQSVAAVLAIFIRYSSCSKILQLSLPLNCVL